MKPSLLLGFVLVSISQGGLIEFPLGLAAESIPSFFFLPESISVKSDKNKCFDSLDDSVAKGIEITKLCASGKHDETYTLLGPFLKSSVDTLHCFAKDNQLAKGPGECVKEHLETSIRYVQEAVQYFMNAQLNDAISYLVEAARAIVDIRTCF